MILSYVIPALLRYVLTIDFAGETIMVKSPSHCCEKRFGADGRISSTTWSRC